ncbi:MAG: DUF58 domain-containing protein [Thermoanaerobaculia bacterium]|nr:DUF58 domain-containing protein [Thermoanaerobaculia bacterium]
MFRRLASRLTRRFGGSSGDGGDRRYRASVPERIRPTKVGLWYIVSAVLVGVAATNTGNNALYIVLALMLGILVVTGTVSRVNLRRLECDLDAPEEIHAKQPFHLRLEVRNRGRWMPRWLLVFSVSDRAQPLLVPHLPRAGRSRGFMETMLPRRGRHRFRWVHVGSIFPVGFFHKGMRYETELEVLVYPELYPAAVASPVLTGARGEGASRKVGWGHDLHALRAFQQGDDPRGIHWKQSARTGELIYTEREVEEGQRLSIVFDNAVGELDDPGKRRRFERLVSEAATAAVDYLDRGYEVELSTRERHLPFRGGRQQRREILETLALVEPVPVTSEPLLRTSPGRGLELRLGLGRSEDAA